jgi:hypothetical protein
MLTRLTMVNESWGIDCASRLIRALANGWSPIPGCPEAGSRKVRDILCLTA